MRIYLAVAVVALLLVAMIGYNALRPSSSQADRIRETATFIINSDFGSMDEAERERLREQWDTYTLETKREIFKEVARHRVTQLRARLAGLSEEERLELIRETTEELRGNRESLTQAERERVRERLNSAEGREMVRTALEVFHEAFTARERAELDPLMREWLSQVEQMAGS